MLDDLNYITPNNLSSHFVKKGTISIRARGLIIVYGKYDIFYLLIFNIFGKNYNFLMRNLKLDKLS